MAFKQEIARTIRNGGCLEDPLPDGIPTNEFGHLLMAKAILDVWNIHKQ